MTKKTRMKAYKMGLKAHNTMGNGAIKNETKRAEDLQPTCQIKAILERKYKHKIPQKKGTMAILEIRSTYSEGR
jgi:hypothetical protein